MLGDAAPVPEPPLLVEDGQLDEGVVEPEAGRPDDGVDRESGAVGERHRRAVRCGGASAHADALLARARGGLSR